MNLQCVVNVNVNKDANNVDVELESHSATLIMLTLCISVIYPSIHSSSFKPGMIPQYIDATVTDYLL